MGPDAHALCAQVEDKKYDVGIKGVLQALNTLLENHTSIRKLSLVDWEPYPEEGLTKAEELTQDFLWKVRRRH